MILTITLECFVALASTTALLILFGSHIKFSSRTLALVLALGVALGSGEVVARIWRAPSSYLLIAELLVLACCAVVIMANRWWNPIGQLFFGCYVAASLAFLTFTAHITVAGHLSLGGRIASTLLWVLEFSALTLSGSFAFENCDVTCRTRWTRRITVPSPDYRPMVSLQVAAYNEPPDMFIETIKSLEAIDYPRFEIVIIDNNTKDPDVWKPVEDYCRDRERLRFIHVDPWPGFKSGALNLVLAKHTDPDAELVGVVDADYLVDPNYLNDVVGYFIDPELAFLQTPQDYREYKGNAYFTACYDAYKYFFDTTMPSRNERNSIIFAGTMGLIRKKVLEELGGWDEWVITEDAEMSLRALRAGYSGLFINRPYGNGVMPLTFSSLKGQRFRWCFGGMQILRKHFKSLMPWNLDPDNHLTFRQRMQYLLSELQWLIDFLYLGFTLVLSATIALLLIKGHVSFRPLLGPAALLPAALIASGLTRAMWGLRIASHIGLKRSMLAFLNWLSLSWTVSLACIQGLFRSEGVFLRTPKWKEGRSVVDVVREAKAETFLGVAIWTAGAMVIAAGRASALLIFLIFWQGFVYLAAPFMSWLNVRAELPSYLERRRRTEFMRERIGTKPLLAGFSVALVALIGLAAFGIGGADRPPDTSGYFFSVPERPANDKGPLEQISEGDLFQLTSLTATPEPSPSTAESPSPIPSSISDSPTPASSTLPSPSPEPSAIQPSPDVSPSDAPSPSP